MEKSILNNPELLKSLKISLKSLIKEIYKHPDTIRNYFLNRTSTSIYSTPSEKGTGNILHNVLFTNFYKYRLWLFSSLFGIVPFSVINTALLNRYKAASRHKAAPFVAFYTLRSLTAQSQVVNYKCFKNKNNLFLNNKILIIAVAYKSI